VNAKLADALAHWFGVTGEPERQAVEPRDDGPDRALATELGKPLWEGFSLLELDQAVSAF
jgi:hypothetical protein